ncbi:Ldh family oxidoreductase [Cohnella hongkongensis]|uniref:Ldh family oxidoreductase n=1 Tax=Cohnella hongkongensis TaxID=178337 RepID=A0ABV9F6M9_9BACL
MSDKQTSLLMNASELSSFGRQVLTRLGMPESDARIAADSLVRADLEGNESHGISRLPIYARRMQEGRIAANPDIAFDETGVVLKVNGGNGLGQVVAYRAIERAIPLARTYGLAGVFVRGSNHFGTAAYFCQQACEADLAMMAMTNSPPGIPPWGGKQAFFGTNPVAFGFPRREAPPIIVDMSSSVVARGKIILANKTGSPIPSGWAIDENGADTTDPAAALRGAVLPLGGAKGYALAMAIEVMCSVLGGAAFGPHVNNLYKDGDPPANVGHSFILFDMVKWMDKDDYFDRLDDLVREVKQVPRAAGSDEIHYPGERRHARHSERSASGLSISPEVANELRQLGDRLGVELSSGGSHS